MILKTLFRFFVMVSSIWCGVSLAQVKISIQKYPVVVSKPTNLTTFEVSTCEESCKDFVGTRIRISGGEFFGEQLIRIGSATTSLKLTFADVDGDGVREFFLHDAIRISDHHGNVQMFRLGHDQRFVAVPVYETDQDQPTPTQVVVTRPYGISRANGLVFAGIGIIAVPLSWFQSVDEVNCYRIRDGVLLEFATWAYDDDDDESSPTKKPIKLKESLTIPISSRLRSLAPIKTKIVRGRTRIVANATESLFRELCVKSEKRYRRQQKNALIK